jgi:hypothetical protein
MNIDSGTCAEVLGFSAKLGSVKKVPIITAAVAYDCPISFQTYILVFIKVSILKILHYISSVQINYAYQGYMLTIALSNSYHRNKGQPTLIELYQVH